MPAVVLVLVLLVSANLGVPYVAMMWLAMM